MPKARAKTDAETRLAITWYSLKKMATQPGITPKIAAISTIRFSRLEFEVVFLVSKAADKLERSFISER
jgi:hypothetical protein